MIAIPILRAHYTSPIKYFIFESCRVVNEKKKKKIGVIVKFEGDSSLYYLDEMKLARMCKKMLFQLHVRFDSTVFCQSRIPFLTRFR